MIKYYISNGILKLARYELEYTTSISSTTETTTSTSTVLINNETALQKRIQMLIQIGAEYNVTELQVTGYEKFDGVEVASAEEAEQLINPSIETLIKNKNSELSEYCEQKIHDGVDVVIGDETKHFSLTTEDQLNINSLVAQINLGNADGGVTYHADGEMCRIFSVEEFKNIFNCVNKFIVEEITYCNHLMAFVKTLVKREDIEDVTYGQELSGEFLENYNSIVGGE